MERLTERHVKKSDGYYMKCSEHCENDTLQCDECDELDGLVDRLGSIEDILGPDYDLPRLRELVEADRDGRCVVLPCKRGDTLWTFCNYPQSKVYSFKVTDVSTLNGRTMFNTDILSVVDARDVGKTVFLTREAAEAALKREQNG